MMITDERIMLPKKKKKKWRTFRIENQVSSSYLKFVSDCYQVREKKNISLVPERSSAKFNVDTAQYSV